MFNYHLFQVYQKVRRNNLEINDRPKAIKMMTYQVYDKHSALIPDCSELFAVTFFRKDLSSKVRF